MVFLYLLPLFLICVSGQSVSPLQNQTVVTGGRVVIPCTVQMVTSSAIFWTRDIHYLNGTQEVYYAYQSTEKNLYEEQYDVEGDKTRGQFNLVIKTAAMSDAGRYTCKLMTSNPIQSIMNLVVVESPVITSSAAMLAGTSVELSCEAAFGAPREDLLGVEHKPFIQGYINNQILNNVVSTVDPGIPGKELWRAVYRSNQTITEDFDQKTFQCELRSEMPFYSVISEQTMEVQYKVSTITLTPVKDTYQIGESINCTANGNPAPTYTWRATESPGARPVYTNSLQILQTMVGKNVWECQAQNKPVSSDLPEMVSKEISFIVEEEKEEVIPPQTTASVNIVAIVVPIVVILLLAVSAVLAFLYYNKKKRYNAAAAAKAKSSAESDAGETEDEEDGPQPARKMLPPTVKEPVYAQPEKAPLQKSAVKEVNFEDTSNNVSAEAGKRDSDQPPTPPPPLRDSYFLSRDQSHDQNGNMADETNEPPAVKPKPQVAQRPVPKARSPETIAVNTTEV